MKTGPSDQEEEGDVWSLYFVIYVVPYPDFLNYSYSDCSKNMDYTGGRWIQLVQLQYVFVLYFIYICVCRRGCCRIVGERILLITMYVLQEGNGISVRLSAPKPGLNTK